MGQLRLPPALELIDRPRQIPVREKVFRLSVWRVVDQDVYGAYVALASLHARLWAQCRVISFAVRSSWDDRNAPQGRPSWRKPAPVDA